MKASSAAATSRYAPRDPETFFHAQRRARHATWRMTALAIVAALLMGLPLTLILTPLLYGFGLIVADIVEFISPLPQQFWDSAKLASNFVVVAADALANQKPIDPEVLALGAAIALLPGVVLALLMWIGVRAFFRRGGVGGALMRLNAREPNHGDLKELQLADVAQEMAIAAGIPAPVVLLADSPGANAAAVGTCAADARLVISRPLLDLLERDELEAVLATLIASIANGDLHIAFTVSSVFETAGLMATIISAPFAKGARQALWRMLRYAFRPSPAAQSHAALDAERAAEAEMLAALLSGNLNPDSDASFAPTTSPLRKFIRVVFFPFIFTNMAIQFTLWVFLDGLLGPCMALAWRARRYLADASAVELTRNPDGLASALQQLSESESEMPGGEWATHLFVVNPKGDSGLRGMKPRQADIQKIADAWLATAPAGLSGSADAQNYYALFMEFQQTALAARAGDTAAAARLHAFQKAVPRAAQQLRLDDLLRDGKLPGSLQQATPKQGSASMQEQCMMSFHPPLARRLKRLQRMGAHFTAPGMTRGVKIAMTVMWLVIGPLLAVAGALMLVVVAMLVMINLMFLGAWLAAIHAALTALRAN